MSTFYLLNHWRKEKEIYEIVFHPKSRCKTTIVNWHIKYQVCIFIRFGLIFTHFNDYSILWEKELNEKERENGTLTHLDRLSKVIMSVTNNQYDN